MKGDDNDILLEDNQDNLGVEDEDLFMDERYQKMYPKSYQRFLQRVKENNLKKT